MPKVHEKAGKSSDRYRSNWSLVVSSWGPSAKFVQRRGGAEENRQESRCFRGFCLGPIANSQLPIAGFNEEREMASPVFGSGP
jgi:hypothetical protein